MLQSIHETSKALKLSERHVRRMISEGRWPYYRLGRRAIRLDVDEIKKLGKLIAEGKLESLQGLIDVGKQDGGSI